MTKWLEGDVMKTLWVDHLCQKARNPDYADWTFSLPRTDLYPAVTCDIGVVASWPPEFALPS